MNPIHVHNLLRQLANEVKCPHCSANVRPDTITLENSTQNYCLLRIQCHACHETFHGHAHIGVKVTSKDGKPISPDTPSTFNNLPPPPAIISEQDLDNLQKALQSEAQGFSDLFSSKK